MRTASERRAAWNTAWDEHGLALKESLRALAGAESPLAAALGVAMLAADVLRLVQHPALTALRQERRQGRQEVHGGRA
ncbi:MAG: hypothetical protein H6739_20900 [Alphaproteobacteria bacterium]|nr:hypothetical protein [Alphaproteobacteria bacterium]